MHVKIVILKGEGQKAADGLDWIMQSDKHTLASHKLVWCRLNKMDNGQVVALEEVYNFKH